ncbi:MAG: FkbM family methyltransferase [Candidatus Accumulibacter phosphatis]|nr:FkbM family methyltransferase [Candidatus Accumulibacter phosphatis]
MPVMPSLLDRMLPAALQPPPPLRQPFLIYGAGKRGLEIADFLGGAGLAPIGFADRRVSADETLVGLPLHTIADWASQLGAGVGDVAVVVAIHNPNVAMAPLLASLRALGFGRVISPVELQACFASTLADAYWLTAPARYARFADRLCAVEALFAEDKSRDILQRTVAFRLGGDYAVLPAPSLTDQYQPADLPRWRDPMRLIDCGAYVGDTIAALARNRFHFAAIAAFEPDPANFTRLQRNIGTECSTVCFPCGVSDATALKTFSASASAASCIDADCTDGHSIQCVAIDDALHNFAPTLIKMDIEGEEHAALNGAQRTIAASRPALAVSLYHCPEHLWEIPLLIDSWQLGHRFFLRSHAHSSFDLVLYAVPD